MQVTYKGELEKPSEEQDKRAPDRRKIRKGPVWKRAQVNSMRLEGRKKEGSDIR